MFGNYGKEYWKLYSREYNSWHNMKQRCLNIKDPRYKDWGGRGITICKRWMNFEYFIKDMGLRPQNTTLERINNDGNYEPTNCKWATQKEQSENRRRKLKGKDLFA